LSMQTPNLIYSSFPKENNKSYEEVRGVKPI
jgi:hypothetical protein